MCGLVLCLALLNSIRAAFSGTRIILRQVSPESEYMYDFIIALYMGCDGDWPSLAQEAGISDTELKYMLEYFTMVLGNLGNYKFFGDAKFVPRSSPQTFETLATKAGSGAMSSYERFKSAIYADTTRPALMHFGFPAPQGHMSNYYPDSPDITQKEIEEIGDLLSKKNLLPENTRLRKTADGDYEVLVASALSKPPSEDTDVGLDTDWTLKGGSKVVLAYGDHQEEMAKAALHIKKAGQYAANDTQKRMMDAYAQSFGTGSLQVFKESQKLWVKDLSPAVESNIGFIETFRDPAGVRGEWEGFVAMVNKDRTLVYKKLVDAAPAMIPQLPWSKDFEKDKFTSPDFTSLEVLSFATSGLPAGINIVSLSLPTSFYIFQAQCWRGCSEVDSDILACPVLYVYS